MAFVAFLYVCTSAKIQNLLKIPREAHWNGAAQGRALGGDAMLPVLSCPGPQHGVTTVGCPVCSALGHWVPRWAWPHCDGHVGMCACLCPHGEGDGAGDVVPTEP